MLRGCDSGILQRLDYSKIAPREGFLPGSALDCGMGLDVYGDVLAYDTTVLKERADLGAGGCSTRRPGRASGRMRKVPQGNLEWALMADGVPIDQVYKVLATPGGRRSRLRQAGHHQEGHRLVVGRRAAAAVAGLA